MKRIFITGASGFLGMALLQELLQEDVELICLLRDPSKIPTNIYVDVPHRIKFIQGDLFADVSTALMGVDTVVHIAAITKQNLLKFSEYKRFNYDATVMLFESAIKAGVKNFIYISSANTIANNYADAVENYKGIAPPFTRSNYALSKFYTEQYLKSRSTEINVSILNPSFIISDELNKKSSNKLLYYLYKSKIIFYPTGGKNFVHVKDVIQTIRFILNQNLGIKNLLITGENYSYQMIVDEVLLYRQNKPIKILIPTVILRLMGKIGDAFNWFGYRFFINSNIAEILCFNNFYKEYSIEKLNLPSTKIQDTLKKIKL